MAEAQAAPPVAPNSDIVFAGAEPIAEEDQGNLFDGSAEDLSPPAPDANAVSDAESGATPPPAESTPPAEPPVAAQTDQAAQPDADGTPPPEPVAEQPPAAAAPPEADGTPPQGDADVSASDPLPSLTEAPVPSYRLAQEAARRRQAEAQLEHFRAQLENQQSQLQQPPVPNPNQAPPVPAAPAAPPEVDLDFGDDARQMFDKAVEGDIDKANELFNTMMKQAANKIAAQTLQAAPAHEAPAAPTQEELNALVQQQVMAVQHQQQEQSVIEKLEQAVPQFNPNSDTFNKALVDETIALKHAYIQQQYTPAAALERAAMAAMQMHQINMPRATQASPVTPDPKSVERNLAAAQQQPPVVPPGTTAGAGVTDVDVMALSDDDLAELPATTQARLRGDIV